MLHRRPIQNHELINDYIQYKSRGSWSCSPASNQSDFPDLRLLFSFLDHTSEHSQTISPNSHVFLRGTGGLSLLHGLVGSHPRLALPPLPPPACSCPPATLHIHLLPETQTPPPLLPWSLQEEAGSRGRWAPEPSFLCCSAEDERVLLASGAEQRMIQVSWLSARHPSASAPLQTVDIPAPLHLVVKWCSTRRESNPGE